MFSVYHTVDSLGGRCCAEEGWHAGDYESYGDARAVADDLTERGLCGYVRGENGETLLPAELAADATEF